MPHYQLSRLCLLIVVGRFHLPSSPTNIFASAKEDDPPINPFLAQSPWPIIHANPYQQGSSSFPGPTTADGLALDVTPMTTGIAPLYDTDLHLWVRLPYMGTTAWVERTPTTLRTAAVHREGLSLDGLQGAYTLVDVDDVFYNGRGTSIQAFQSIDGEVEKIHEYFIPGGDSDPLIGLNLLYDGTLVYTTAKARVGVIGRDFASNEDQIRLGGEGMNGNEQETISNSLAVDENGGIYVVTSGHMYRVQWDGASLSVAWRAAYDTGGSRQTNGGRLGAGSGSTPSLMGTRDGEDKFVVITDGAALMNVVLFWRDAIPDDWVPVVPAEPRIAAQVPVTFGDPSATKSISEQSVLVRGYSAAVVNNEYGIRIPAFLPSIFSQLIVLLTNLPFIAPFGVEKFTWNPTTRTLDTAWASRAVSCPNGIPTMSAPSNLLYCIGQRWMAWTLEAVDWETGESVFARRMGWWPGYNSVYAALEVGPDAELVTGALTGAVRFRPTTTNT